MCFVLETGRSGYQRSNGKPWEGGPKGITFSKINQAKTNYSCSLLAEALKSYLIKRVVPRVYIWQTTVEDYL